VKAKNLILFMKIRPQFRNHLNDKCLGQSSVVRCVDKIEGRYMLLCIKEKYIGEMTKCSNEQRCYLISSMPRAKEGTFTFPSSLRVCLHPFLFMLFTQPHTFCPFHPNYSLLYNPFHISLHWTGLYYTLDT
jgi:hypothetical protein